MSLDGIQLQLNQPRDVPVYTQGQGVDAAFPAAHTPGDPAPRMGTRVCDWGLPTGHLIFVDTRCLGSSPSPSVQRRVCGQLSHTFMAPPERHTGSSMAYPFCHCQCPGHTLHDSQHTGPWP